VDNEHDEVAVESESQSVGTVLRRCREFSEISLEDAAEATKIGKNYLRALEADRYQELPSPVYLKGFLRTYATYLGLDPEELIRLLTPQNGSMPLDSTPAGMAIPKVINFNWQRLILPAVLLVALIIVALVVTPPPSERPRTTTPQQVVPVAPVAAVQPVHSSVTNPTPAVQQIEDKEKLPEITALPTKPQNSFLVRMKVNRASTLSVTIDDAASQGYTLASGDLIEWKAARTIVLDLSDAGSVEIELNGAPVKLQSSQGKPAYIVLDANGIKH